MTRRLPWGMVRVMTVKKLKQLLENIPDGHFVLVPARDHSYRSADVSTDVEFEYYNDDHMSEYHEGDITVDSFRPEVHIFKAIVIS